MTVVALHGFAGSGADWGPFERELGCSLIAPDLLGHGAAAAPNNSEAYRAGPMVKFLAQGLPPDGPVVLLGYSMGGRVALRLAPQLGPRLCGLVLMGAHPGLEDSVERSERIAADQSVAGRSAAHSIPAANTGRHSRCHERTSCSEPAGWVGGVAPRLWSRSHRTGLVYPAVASYSDSPGDWGR